MRIAREHPDAPGRRLAVTLELCTQTPEGRVEPLVITTYSIHYTKLYDGETVRYRGAGANRAAARGAVAALVRSVGPVSLRTPHSYNFV